MIKSKTMKKSIAVMISLWMMIVLSVVAFAEGQRVFDDAGLFTEDEIDELESAISVAVKESQVDIAIITTNDTNGKEVRVFTADTTEEHGVGYGAQRDLIALGIDMGERQTATIVNSDLTNIFPVDVTNAINDAVLDYMKQGDIFGAANTFVELSSKTVENYYSSNQSDDIYEVPSPSPEYSVNAPDTTPIYLSIIIGLAVGSITVGIMWGMHPRTSGVQAQSYSYLDQRGIHLSKQKDIFMFTHTSKTEIPKDDDNNNSSSGGSFSSSSGNSYSGSSGSF